MLKFVSTMEAKEVKAFAIKHKLLKFGAIKNFEI